MEGTCTIGLGLDGFVPHVCGVEAGHGEGGAEGHHRKSQGANFCRGVHCRLEGLEGLASGVLDLQSDQQRLVQELRDLRKRERERDRAVS
jgi:hypothetical protein